jgi:hypothetical protein
MRYNVLKYVTQEPGSPIGADPGQDPHFGVKSKQ